MNQTIKDATVTRFHDDDYDQLRWHLGDFINAYTFGRRLKTLKGLTTDEFISKQWTSEPKRVISNPIRQMPGLNNTYRQRLESIELPAIRVRMEESEKNELKMSISRSVRKIQDEIAIDLSATHDALVKIEERTWVSTRKRSVFMKEPGLPSLPELGSSRAALIWSWA